MTSPSPAVTTPSPPHFTKKVLSIYFRNRCERQARLYMYKKQAPPTGAPDRQQARFGRGLMDAGNDWQNEKVAELEAIVGSGHILQTPLTTTTGIPRPIDLASLLRGLAAHMFVVEGEFDAEREFKAIYGLGSLRDEYGNALSIGRFRPDLIQVRQSLATNPAACKEGLDEYGRIVPLDPTDDRLQLRVIDIKMASEPGTNYYAEVVYYSVALAAWLKGQPDGDRFVVIPEAAVWGGTFEQTKLQTLGHRRLHGGTSTPAELEAALDEELEVAEFRVYLPRLRSFFQKDLPHLLQTPWTDLPWHLSFRCQGCEYLGYDWGGTNSGHLPDHCWQIAERSDLHMRVFGLTAVTTGLLSSRINTVASLAALPPADGVFEETHALEVKRQIIPARAKALDSGTAFAIPDSGKSASQPSFVNLDIYIFLDYDSSSSITASMAIRSYWRQPDVRAPVIAKTLSDHDEFLVSDRTTAAEQREFLKFLRKLQAIIDAVLDEEADRSDPRTAYQIYVWDEAQYRHLTRLIGRHLQAIMADNTLRQLSWLFPAEALLPDPTYASRQSPVTILSTTIENHVAVPVPVHYSLYEVAQHLVPTRSDGTRESPVVILDRYKDPLNNLIPPDRLYDMWNKRGSASEQSDNARRIHEMTAKKAQAMQQIVRWLRGGSGVTLALSAAPKLKLTRRPSSLRADSNLWHQHTKLNQKLSEMEIERVYALSPAVREAKFKAARLDQLLTGTAESGAIAVLNAHASQPLLANPNLLVYSLNPRSRDVRFKEGDFNLALSPRDEPLFLLKQAENYLPGIGYGTVRSAKMTAVKLAAIDRDNLYIAFEISPHSPIHALRRGGFTALDRDVMVDVTPMDALTKKVELSLKGISVPAGYTPLSTQAGNIVSTPASNARAQRRPDAATAQAFLFTGAQMAAAPVARNTAALKTALEAEGVSLNASQWDAWAHTLTHRLSLIWGPPGTGKSETLRAIIRAAAQDAQDAGRPLRVLITANNYTAVDNVLLKLEKTMRGRAGTSLYRVQHASRRAPAELASHPAITNILLDKSSPGADTIALRQKLTALGQTPANPEVVIVGTPTQQVHNLAVAGTGEGTTDTLKSWFDLVVIDEATQMDVASSTLIYGKLAPGGQCVLAGDHLQLPPIHQVEPPTGQEAFVGSVYSFMLETHGVQPRPLLVNYRSNSEIVEFGYSAGYPRALKAYSPALRLNHTSPLPNTQPATWPASLEFSPEWARLLDPDKPVVCVVYDDAISGQTNDFEAQSIAALITALDGNMGEPSGHIQPDGRLAAVEVMPYAQQHFWEKGVGVVAPHRAQGSRILDQLHRAFPTIRLQQIMSAVDTVERYQGQERDVILGSFGVGDPDTIGTEEEFLFNLNRFNVMVSRATSKVIVFATRSLLDHLAGDQDVVRHSKLLKEFAETYCDKQYAAQLPYRDRNGARQVQDVIIRYR